MANLIRASTKETSTSSIRHPRIISIEGNIGSGKSTLLNKLRDQLQAPNELKIGYMLEPVDVWNTVMDKQGVPILEKYYANQTRYAFPFQMMAYISRLAILREAIRRDEYDVIIMERSIFTDCHVFAKMLFDDGKLEDIEYEIYQRWFREFVPEIRPIDIIYIRASPSVADERVKQRSRPGEQEIPLSYLQNCHQYHEDWLNAHKDYDAMLTLDGDKEIGDMLPEWLSMIQAFLKRKD